jgi:serine/threonine protein kinase
MQKSFFHHYYLTQLLDQQKFKSTYLAYPQGDMKLKVVVKIFNEECLLPNHDYAKSLTTIKGFLALDHPHIVPILNMDVENRQPYIVTTYMPHGSLRQRLDALAPKLMHWTTAVNIVIQIAQALMYAHERHVIHGNIKPNNILFDLAGEALLTDFRPSQFIDISKLNYKTDLQTTSYMAPEQFMGKSTPFSDQYSLACLTYALLTGHAPFSDAQNFSLQWQKHATALPPSITTQVPEVPMPIEAAILKALSKNPEMRYPDIVTFAHALESELPASAVRKGKVIPPSELDLAFPRPLSPPPPQQETNTIKRAALTRSLPIVEDSHTVKKSALTGSMPIVEDPHTVKRAALTRSLPIIEDLHTIKKSALTGSVPIVEDPRTVKKSALTGSVPIPGPQDTPSEEKPISGMSTPLVAHKTSHPGIKYTRLLLDALSSLSGYFPQKTIVKQKIRYTQQIMLSAFIMRWRNQRFKPSKRFVISTCALAIVVILSTALFIFNNLSVATHQTSFRNGSTPYVTVTVGRGTTPTPNVITNALGTPVAVATGTLVTNPGVSGGKGGKGGKGGNGGGSTSTPPPTTSTVTPVVSGTSVPPTSVPPTPTPMVTNNRAQISTVNASSSFEGGGWSIAHINDDVTNSTPGSMGWSSAGDFVVNHTEWITFDFGSSLAVGRIDLFPRSDPGNVGQGFPVDFTVQLSFDDSTWRTVVNQSGYPMPGSTENQVFFFPVQQTRYLMVQATSLRPISSEYNRYRMQFSEICIY